MGKSSKPLRLIIEQSIDGPTFQTLREQGYSIEIMQEVLLADGDAYPVDIFLGPRCWMMTPEVASNPKLLEAAIKNARAIRYHADSKPKADTGSVVKTDKPIRKPRRKAAKPTDSSDSRPPEVSGPATNNQTSHSTGDGEDSGQGC